MDLPPHLVRTEIHAPLPAIISEKLTNKDAKCLLKNMIAQYSEMTERELAKSVTRRDMLGLMWLIDQLQKEEE
jgi:hypothetical protein